MIKKKWTVLALLMVAFIALAACDSSNGGTAETDNTEIPEETETQQPEEDEETDETEAAVTEDADDEDSQAIAEADLSSMSDAELIDYICLEGEYYTEAVDEMLSRFEADFDQTLTNLTQVAAESEDGELEPFYLGIGSRVAELEKEGDSSYLELFTGANTDDADSQTQLETLQSNIEYWRNH